MQLVSLTLAELSILMLPIDAANKSGAVQCNESWSDVFCGSMDMEAAWQTLFLLIFIFALFVVPYTIFYYEEDDSLALTWVGSSVFFIIIVFFVLVVIVVVVNILFCVLMAFVFVPAVVLVVFVVFIVSPVIVGCCFSLMIPTVLSSFVKSKLSDVLTVHI